MGGLTTSLPAGARERGSRKEQFDLCIGMLKAYYDALEGRLEKTMTLLMVVMGWLLTQTTFRSQLEQPRLLGAAVATLSVFIALYCWSILHWIKRFRQVQKTIDAMDYVDEAYYTRYRFPRSVWFGYLAPVLLVYVFAVAVLILKVGAAD